ncbi:MAG: Hsp70 family protein [Deltaproteobacteria bacterium]|nr:MAG: Hsp70 family protein [Deltaproteobacteria bacterium]
MDSRYSVGIDLGTTNSSVAEVDLAIEPAGPGEPLPAPIPLEVPQMVARQEMAARQLLPSFIYLPPPHEELGEFIVGTYARERGGQVPGRLVSSSKSWLSHPGVDRRSQLLPVGADASTPRISPLDAAARILGQIRAGWEEAHAHEGVSLGGQAVTLTVPASFDAVARELTVQAAAQAGLANLTLLEEPQAALYAWVEAAGDEWRKHVRPGDVILVVDVGGGTSDFSLISVGEDEGRLALTRLAVGDHILLGGDNVDLALAHVVSEKLRSQGTKLDSWQFAALAHACRNAKETGTSSLSIPGRGSGLVGGTIRAEITKEELRRTVDAFFPDVDVAAAPATQRRTGLTTLGLPYAQDPAVTRHLAAFLRRGSGTLARRPGATFLHPTAILFNGGVFKDGSLQERVASLVDRWVRAEGGAPLKLLRSASLDLAVALGASYSGLARRGRGIRIRGGTARAYYVGVEAATPAVPGFAPPVRAVCLAPFGMEEGSTVDLPQLEVGAVVGETASFRFFASSARRDDAPGAVVEAVDDLEELPPIETTLPAADGSAGEVLPVHLRSHVTEVGTLELHLVSPAGRAWKLEFSVRQE